MCTWKKRIMLRSTFMMAAFYMTLKITSPKFVILIFIRKSHLSIQWEDFGVHRDLCHQKNLNEVLKLMKKQMYLIWEQSHLAYLAGNSIVPMKNGMLVQNFMISQ